MASADWIYTYRGIDPAGKFRGAYSSEAECFAVLKAAGGMKGIMVEAMNAYGFVQTASPAAGDVGLVRAPVRRTRSGRTAHTLVGGICAAPARWAVLTRDKHLVIAPLYVVMAWRV